MKSKTLLLITDISGFTRFVAQRQVQEGIAQAREMLEIIVRSNSLGLHLSEIEGDAVFFHSNSTMPSHIDLVNQLRLTYSAFTQYLRRHGLENLLGLKFVVHVGECLPIEIDGRTGLYGLDVIKIHRLLKNVVPRKNYVMITEQARAHLGMDCRDAQVGQVTYQHIGSIDYYVYDDAFLSLPHQVALPKHPAPRISMARRASKLLSQAADAIDTAVPRLSWVRAALI